MNPEYCLANHPDEYSANSQENVFNPSDFQLILNNDNSDLDIKFFNKKFYVAVSPYFTLEEILCKVENFLPWRLFSVLHVNIGSLNKHFEKLHEFLASWSDVITISETW